MTGMIRRIRQWAASLKRETVALWFACKSPQTPLHAKAVALFAVGYALSPIDLIPDFIPVLGFVDDAILLPLLIWLALRLVPAGVLEQSRLQADEWIRAGEAKPRSHAGAVVIVLVWIAAGVLAYRYFAA